MNKVINQVNQVISDYTTGLCTDIQAVDAMITALETEKRMINLARDIYEAKTEVVNMEAQLANMRKAREDV